MSALCGKTIVFAGKLKQDRGDAKAAAEAAGAKVTAAMSGKTDILVAAASSGCKPEDAMRKGIDVWTEEKFNTQAKKGAAAVAAGGGGGGAKKQKLTGNKRSKPDDHEEDDDEDAPPKKAAKKGAAATASSERKLKGGAKKMSPQDTKDALQTAAEDGDLDTVVSLVDFSGAWAVNSTDRFGCTPLVMAMNRVENADTAAAIAKVLITNGSANVNLRSKHGEVPLHKAAERGFKECVALLLAAGAKPDAKAMRGHTALMYAAQHRHFDIVKMLIEKATVDMSESIRGCTALLFAVRSGATDIVLYLLDKGARIDRCGAYGGNPLHMAAEGDHLATLQVIIEKSGDKLASMLEEKERGYGRTPFEVAKSDGVRAALTSAVKPRK